ncbi:hypothetical protein RSPO_m00156 (plasmid) [Ralstonia solanacearum Po82]|uniref:Uncharacterized protein n=1 Tax=Ralstonia solanacearum (strain Po82) TaxID=1031711 RepID=F6G846_RALS8|nr:hypothetical protein RSPO_m00156 [Ralstonia solanacearum Po82]
MPRQITSHALRRTALDHAGRDCWQRKSGDFAAKTQAHRLGKIIGSNLRQVMARGLKRVGQLFMRNIMAYKTSYACAR